MQGRSCVEAARVDEGRPGRALYPGEARTGVMSKGRVGKGIINKWLAKENRSQPEIVSLSAINGTILQHWHPLVTTLPKNTK